MTVPSEELLAVNDALAALALEDPQAAEVVQMRYFVGMTVPEIAGRTWLVVPHGGPALGLRPGLVKAHHSRVPFEFDGLSENIAEPMACFAANLACKKRGVSSPVKALNCDGT
jgi:hypothetical protein